MAKRKPQPKQGRGKRKPTKGVTPGQRQRKKALAREDQQAGRAAAFRALLIERAGKDTALVKVIAAMSEEMVLGLEASITRDSAPAAAAADPRRSQLYARAWEHLTNPLQRAFLSAFAVNGGFVTQAAAAAGIDRRTHTGWMHKDAEYKAAFEEAVEVAADLLEAEAHRRAFEGLVSFKFNKFGEPLVHPVTGKPYYELSFSDALIIKRLEARRPELYRRKQLEVSGPNGAPLGGFRGDLRQLSDAELKTYEALVRKMMPAGEGM